MSYFLEYLFVFCFCATLGWLIEVVYRSIRHRKVVNPGFLTGCWLPLYGVGGLVLYLLSGLAEVEFLPHKALRIAVILVAAMVVMTLIELVGGLIATRYFHVKLWDYSKEWLNYQGIICPRFSFFWGLIAAVFLFFIYPLLRFLAKGVAEWPWMILLLGIYAGIFLVDLWQSMHIMQRLRDYAAQMRTHINMEQLKTNARDHFRRQSGKRSPFNFYNMISRYLTDMHGYRDKINRRWGKKDDEETD
jgi:uncharacterized membrane protein